MKNLINFNLYSDNMTREEFEEKCMPLYNRYWNIFYETLKEHALNIWLSDSQRKDIADDWFLRRWDKYTDFFSNLDEELDRRFNNWYYDINDLFDPSLKNLESQVTESIIRYEFLKEIIGYASFFEKIGYLCEIDDIFEFYEMFKENKLEDYIKQKIPPHSFDDKISIKYTEDELLEVYNEEFKMPSYPEKDLDFDYLWIWHRFAEKFFSLYEKDPNDKISILGFLNKSASLFNDFSYDIIYRHRNIADDNWYIKERTENYKWKGVLVVDGKTSIIDDDWVRRIADEELDDEWLPIDSYKLVKNSDFLEINWWIVDKLDFYLLDIFNRFKNDIVWDAQIVYLYYWYIVEKFKCLNSVEFWINEWFENNSWKNYVSRNKLRDLIEWLKDTQDIYEILQIYYMLYSDILKRGEYEQFFKEAIYKIKKLTNKDTQIALWIKVYLTHVLNNVFIDENWGNKPEYFDSISEDIKEVLWEEEYKNIELLFSGNSLCKWDKNIRKDYKIWLIFWDTKSKKAYELYCNDKKSEKDFIDRQLTKRQFDILAEEYYDQQRLDIEWKLKRGDLTFILVFEMDHETKLRNLSKIYPDRIIVCNVPGQHFSFEQFRKMLDLGLRNIEWN